MKVKGLLNLKNSLLLTSLLLVSGWANAIAEMDYWEFWDASNPYNRQAIDHSQWQYILRSYVVTNHPSGINRFRYSDVDYNDLRVLDSYIKNMSRLDPRHFRKSEQKAYWLNLYNALTVQQILKNYPLKQKLSASSGNLDLSQLWDKKVVKIKRHKLSRNDIEHRILRPIFKDHRIHFGLSCATLSCADILPVAFTSWNTKNLLVQAGRDYIAHPRGVKFSSGNLLLSSIFEWYRDDFAKTDKRLKKVLAHYAVDRKALYLLGYQGDIQYIYDWRLNEP